MSESTSARVLLVANRTAATLELATPLLEEAAGGPVSGLIGDPDPLLAVERALVHEHFDEAIISTLPERGTGARLGGLRSSSTAPTADSAAGSGSARG